MVTSAEARTDARSCSTACWRPAFAHTPVCSGIHSEKPKVRFSSKHEKTLLDCRRLRFRQQPCNNEEQYDNDQGQHSPEENTALARHLISIPRRISELFFGKERRDIFFSRQQLSRDEAQVITR